MPSPALVYLDQAYLGRLCAEYRELRERIVDMVARGIILCPTSLVHVMETCKGAPDIRSKLFLLMGKINGGRYVRNEISIMRLEFAAISRKANVVDCVRSQFLATSLIDAVSPSTTYLWRSIVALGNATDWLLVRRGRGFSVLEALSQHIDSRRINEEVSDVFLHASSSLNAMHRLPSFDVGLFAQALEVSPEMLSADRDGIPVGFPSVAVRHAIQASIKTNTKRGFEANDIADIGFLSSTLPYFDLVTVDRKMGARLREAHRSAPFRASIVSDIHDLDPALTVIEKHWMTVSTPSGSNG